MELISPWCTRRPIHVFWPPTEDFETAPKEQNNQCQISSSWQWIPSSSVRLDALCRLAAHTSLMKELEWCKASSPPKSLAAYSKIIANQRAFLPYNTHVSLYLTLPRWYWAHTPFFSSEPVNVCNEQCKSCSFSLSLSISCVTFLLLLLLLLSHWLSTISPHTPISLSSVSLASQVSICQVCEGHFWGTKTIIL